MKRLVKKFLFARQSYLDGRNVFVAVEAYDKDHAILRLAEKYPYVEKMKWDFLEELDPDHFLGHLGEDLILAEKSKIATIISKLIH
jgi:hypothetical protein